MNWKVKAIFQKILSLTKIGDKLNHIPSTLNKDYHLNKFKYQSYECLRKFKQSNITITEESKALEIGTGYSIISAVILSLLGFNKIITVDITQDLSFSSFKKQIQHIDSNGIIEELISKSIYSKQSIMAKIYSIKKAASLKEVLKELNIIYIAPYTFEDIEKECTNFNYISSQVVLEHVSPNILDTMFYKTKKWLTNDGIIVHTINFIDHFANPGFFQDKSISEFNFLKYSNKYWDSWAGNSIAYTNRLSHLYYFELAKKHNLSILEFIGENYRKRVELNTNLIHPDIINKYTNLKELKEITKYQRGTLILSS